MTSWSLSRKMKQLVMIFWMTTHTSQLAFISVDLPMTKCLVTEWRISWMCQLPDGSGHLLLQREGFPDADFLSFDSGGGGEEVSWATVPMKVSDTSGKSGAMVHHPKCPKGSTTTSCHWWHGPRTTIWFQSTPASVVSWMAASSLAMWKSLAQSRMLYGCRVWKATLSGMHGCWIIGMKMHVILTICQAIFRQEHVMSHSFWWELDSVTSRTLCSNLVCGLE